MVPAQGSEPGFGPGSVLWTGTTLKPQKQLLTEHIVYFPSPGIFIAMRYNVPQYYIKRNVHVYHRKHLNPIANMILIDRVFMQTVFVGLSIMTYNQPPCQDNPFVWGAIMNNCCAAERDADHQF